MQIGFVNFSQEELARKNKVLQMVRDQTAIDELGFGRIRDAFANWMFPGMLHISFQEKHRRMYMQPHSGHILKIML